MLPNFSCYSNGLASTDSTHHPKRHLDPLSRFATIHFPNRQTHRPTDGIGDRSVRIARTLAILIESDALITKKLCDELGQREISKISKHRCIRPVNWFKLWGRWTEADQINKGLTTYRYKPMNSIARCPARSIMSTYFAAALEKCISYALCFDQRRTVCEPRTVSYSYTLRENCFTNDSHETQRRTPIYSRF